MRVGHECPCGFKLPYDMNARVTLLVGFRTDEGPQRADRSGISIFKCSACHEYYWFHLPITLVEFFKRRIPQWPT